jgi:hypothetical protein
MFGNEVNDIVGLLYAQYVVIIEERRHSFLAV